MREGAHVARSVDIKHKAGTQGVLASESAVLEMIARGRPLPEVLEALVGAIEAQADGLFCSVLVLDEDGKHLRHGAAPSLPESFHQAIDGIDIGPRTTPCGAAAHSGEQVIVSDIVTDPLWAHNKELALQYGLRACWSVPIKSGAGKVLGTFAMYHREPRTPSASDFELIERAQHLAVIALERNRVEAELIRSEKRLRVMARARAMTTECNRALVRTAEENRLLQEMCRIGVESGGYRVAWIGLARHDAQKTIQPVAKAGDHEGYFESVRISWADDEHGSGPAGMAVRTGKSQVARHTASDPGFKTWRNEALARGYVAVVALPLVHEDETFGVFGLFAEESDAFGPDEIALLEELANDIAYGVYNLRKREAHRQTEVEVEQSEQRFRSLTDLSSDMYWEQDDQYRFTTASGSGPEWIIKARRRAIGKRRWDSNYLNMNADDWAAHIAVLDARKPFHDLELCRLDESGRKIWVSVSGEPVFDASGVFKGYRGVGKDISLRKRAEQLQALEHAVARSIANVDSVTDAVQAAIRAICETEGWDCGRYLRWDETAGALRFSDAWRVAGADIERFVDKSRDVTYAPGVGLAGKVWQSGEPLWVADISRDTRVAPSPLAGGTGMRGAFVFPVISEGKTLGVLAFNSREIREPEERLLQTIGVIGAQVGQFLQRKRGEEELRRFRAAMDVSADLILLVDPVKIRYLDVNDAACRALGYTRDEFLAMGPQDIFSISREELAELYKRLFEGDRSDEKVEGWYRRKDGSRLPVESSRRAVRSPEGNIVVAVARDITERRRRDEDLRRFRAAMDVSAEMIWLIDPVAMRITDVNETACRKLNYSREELLAKGPQGIIDVPREELARVYNRLITGDELETTAEGWYSRKDGSRFPVEVFRRAVRSEEGHVIVAVGRDVTEQRAAQEDLRRFRLAMDNSADMIVLIDRATMRFVDVNTTASSLLGYSREEFLEMGPQDLLPVSRAELERSYDELIADPSLTSGMNTHYRRKDGTLLPFESTRRVLRSGGTYIIAAISRDIRERIAAETALRESNERFDIAVRATSDIIWDLDLITESLWWNENFTKVFGYPREDVDRTVKSWHDAAHPDDRVRVETGMRRVIESGGESWSDEYRFRRADGSYAEVLDRGHVIRDAAGKAVRMIGAMADVSARKEAEEKMRSQALRQRLVAEFGQQVLASVDLADVLGRAMALVSATLNAEYCNVLELDPEGKRLVFKATVGWPAEWIGRRSVPVVPGSPVDLVLSRREALVFEDLREETRFSASPLLELGVRSGIQVPIYGSERTFGALGAYSQQVRRFTEDDVSFLQTVGNILSVAIERKNTEDQLSYLAQFDSLTGLPNRHLFHDRLAHTMTQARRSSRPMAVLFIDLDRFKLVNDTQGHSAGDKLLKEAATRLNQCVRGGDTVGRFGGDEFGAILSDLAKPGDASIVAQKIIDALARPFHLDGHETYISASVGITLFPADGEEPGALITNADAAMYRAKEQGRNTYQYFTREMNEQALARVHLEAALRRALERKEFLLHYQPKVDLESGAICGVEALLRWQHPERGMVSPVEFIPVLEDSGLIVPVGEWVMREACGQIRVWQQSGLAVPPVAVNLSARQFQQKDLEPIVRSLLAETGVDPSLIQFELTESLLMKEPEAAARTLNGLKDLGVKISVDDFGTGYSSLAYLKRFPIDALKIDRAFIRELTTDPDDAAITLAIIGLAHSLKLRVVAEGVETEGQLNFLSSHACDEMQGYYFAKPAAPAELEAMLREGRRLRRSADGVSQEPVVLLLDDSEQDLLLLEGILRSDNFPVLKTTDPKRAFELLAGHPVGIVISDQNMPGMTGVEFLGHVRKLYPNVLRILTTGADEPKAIADAVNQAGIHKFLSKDGDREYLRAELREAYRRYRPDGGAKFLRLAPLAA